jgi:hypothetical protein
VRNVTQDVRVDAFIWPPRAGDYSDQGSPHVAQLHVVIELKASSQSRATKDLLKYIDQAFLG